MRVAFACFEAGLLEALEEAVLLRVLLAKLQEVPVECLEALVPLADGAQVLQELDGDVVLSRLARVDRGVHLLPGLFLSLCQGGQMSLTDDRLGALAAGLLLCLPAGSQLFSSLAVADRRLPQLSHRSSAPPIWRGVRLAPEPARQLHPQVRVAVGEPGEQGVLLLSPVREGG